MAIVYRHRRLDNNQIFYVGIGTNKKRAFETFGRNNLWNKIVSKSKYNVEIISENITLKDAVELEIFLIELYGRKDLNTGVLSNLTSGGEGSNNMSKESRESIGRHIRERNLGSKQSQETIEKRRLKMLGQKRSEKTIENIKNASVLRGESKATILKNFYTKEIIGEFNSLSDACRFAEKESWKKIDTGKACAVANKKRNRYFNYVFEYKNFDIPTPIKIKKKQINEPLRKLILNIKTGIFYSGLDEANESTGNRFPKLYQRLNGRKKNTTDFIYV